MKINNNLPTVAVHEMAIHPTPGEIVAATHGRSLWVLDVTPLQQLADRVAAAKAYLFKPQSGVLWPGALSSSQSGHHYFTGQNPGFGSACITSSAQTRSKRPWRFTISAATSSADCKGPTRPACTRSSGISARPRRTAALRPSRTAAIRKSGSAARTPTRTGN